MKSWEYISKDGCQIHIRHAVVDDAQSFYNGFTAVVKEGHWLPTFKPNSSVRDWNHWIQRTYHTRDVLLRASIADIYAGHLSLQPEEWMASRHVARLGIVVVKKYRNIGIGQFLMETAEEIAKENEYEKIILSTFDDNEIAISLYNKLGYRKIGVRKKHFKMPKGYIDEILMEKALT